MQLAPHFVLSVIMLFALTIVSKAQMRNVFGLGFPVSSGDVRYNEYQFKKLSQMTKPQTDCNQIDWQEVRQDFLRLQAESNNLSQIPSNSISPDKRLHSAVSAIKKRAASLRRNLPLPDLPEKFSISNNAQLSPKESLRLLDNLVLRFASNSIFKQTSVFNVENAVQARRDLESIFMLSENLKQQLKHLSKNSTRNAKN